MDRTQLTALKAKLPTHPGILAREEYFNSAILVLLLWQGDEYHFVFEKRSMDIRQGGEVSFPGGRISAEDADSRQAAIRETGEELGIPPEKLELVGVLDTLIGPMGAAVDAFLAIAHLTGIEEMNPEPDEVAKVFTLPVSYFVNTVPQSYYATVRVCPSYRDPITGEEIVTLPAQELNLPDRYFQPWGNFPHQVYLYPTEYGPIWGMTAKYILDIVNKLSL